MLIEMIMYNCVEYLLREKNDEESIECLCRLLRTIGKELDAKAKDQVALEQIDPFFVLQVSLRICSHTIKPS
jgi:hypothetical protein